MGSKTLWSQTWNFIHKSLIENRNPENRYLCDSICSFGQNSDLNMSRILQNFFKNAIQLPFLTRKAGKLPWEPSAFQFFLPGKAAERIGNLQKCEQNSAHIRTRILIGKATKVPYKYVHNDSFVWNFKCEFKKFLASLCTMRRFAASTKN